MLGSSGGKRRITKELELGNFAITAPDGTRKIRDKSLNHDATMYSGNALDGDGVGQYVNIPKVLSGADYITICGVVSADISTSDNRIVSSSSGGYCVLTRSNGVFSVRSIEFFDSTRVFTQDEIVSFVVLIDNVNMTLDIILDGVLDSSHALITPFVDGLEYFMTRGQLDGFYGGTIKDLYALPQLMDLDFARNHYRNPEMTLYKDSSGRLLSSNGISQATLDKLEAGVDSFWFPCGENLSASNYAINHGVPIPSNLLLDGEFDTGDGWSAQVDWTIAGGVASCNSLGEIGGRDLTGAGLTDGATYVVVTQIKNYVSGDLHIWDGVSNILVSAGNGVFTNTITLIGRTSLGYNASSVNGLVADIEYSYVFELAGSNWNHIINYVETMRASKLSYGTQAVLSYVNDFGLPVRLAKPFEIVADGKGKVNTGINIGDYDFTALTFVYFNDYELGVEQGLGNAGTNALFNLRVAINGKFHWTVGTKYPLLQLLYDNKPHIAAIRYTAGLTAGTGKAEVFLDGVLASTDTDIDLSGVPDTPVYLTGRNINGTPLVDGSLVGSFTVVNSAQTDEEIGNYIKLLADRHGVTLP